MTSQTVRLNYAGKKEYPKKPVLRNVTPGGPQDVPLTKDNSVNAYVYAAGYIKRPTVHNIRKYLGENIEAEICQHCSLVLIPATGKYGSALVSQIDGHKDPGTYAKDYVLHCSLINQPPHQFLKERRTCVRPARHLWPLASVRRGTRNVIPTLAKSRRKVCG